MNIFRICIFVGMGLMVTSYLQAGENAKKEIKTQTNCPIMKGNKINKKLYVDAKGKRIYVCCKGCIAEVTKNPEKYIKQLEAQGVTVDATPSKAQTNCPIMKGNKINKKLYVDAKGKRIYVCCKGCIAKVTKNPEKYIKQLEAQGVTVDATPSKLCQKCGKVKGSKECCKAENRETCKKCRLLKGSEECQNAAKDNMKNCPLRKKCCK